MADQAKGSKIFDRGFRLLAERLLELVVCAEYTSRDEDANASPKKRSRKGLRMCVLLVSRARSVRMEWCRAFPIFFDAIHASNFFLT